MISSLFFYLSVPYPTDDILVLPPPEIIGPYVIIVLVLMIVGLLFMILWDRKRKYYFRKGFMLSSCPDRGEYLICDQCNGVMKWDGRTLTSNPPKYPHYCSKCGSTKTMFDIYPRIVYDDRKK